MAEPIFTPGRLELSNQQRETARRDGLRITEGKGVVQLRGLCIALCMENMRLLNEVNAYRAHLGLEPLAGYEVR